MADLGMSPVLKGDLRPTSSEVNNRKELRGLRRQLDVDMQDFLSQARGSDGTTSSVIKSPTDGKINKGTSIKGIKKRLRNKRISHKEKYFENFKARKKKKMDTGSKVDSTQHTIYEFFPNKANNTHDWNNDKPYEC